MSFLLNFSSDYVFSKVDTFFDQILQMRVFQKPQYLITVMTIDCYLTVINVRGGFRIAPYVHVVCTWPLNFCLCLLLHSQNNFEI